MDNIYFPEISKYIYNNTRRRNPQIEGYLFYGGSYWFTGAVRNLLDQYDTVGLIVFNTPNRLDANWSILQVDRATLLKAPYDPSETGFIPEPTQPSTDLTPVLSAIDGISADIANTASQIQNTVNNGITLVQATVNNNAKIINNKLTDISKQISDQNNTNVGAISAKIDSSTNSVTSTINNRANSTDNNIRSAQNNILANIFSTAGNIIGAATQSSQQILGAIGIATTHSDIVLNAVGSEIKGDIARAQSSINDAINGALGGIQDFIGNQIAELGKTIQGIIQPFIDFVNNIYQEIVKFWNEKVLGAKKEAYDKGDLFQDILDNLFHPNYANKNAYLDNLKDVKRGTGILSNLLMMIMSIPNIIGITGQLVQPSWDDFIQTTQATTPDKLLSLGDYVQAFIRGIINDDTFFDSVARHGLDGQKAHTLYELGHQLLGVTELRQLYQRGFMSEQDLRKNLSQLGFGGENITYIQKLFDVIPPIVDLIRFTVREVFTPDIAQKYGLFNDYPIQLTEFGKQQGLSEQWSKSYWAAHWELPSATQGFQMFHRGIITEDDLKLLLRALDVMPYWRDKLIQMNYNPITRVDIRRLRKYDLLSEKDLVERYKFAGYSPQDALLLAKFTELDLDENNTNDGTKIRELSTSAITQAYVRNLINKQDALKRLTDLHYRPTDAELLLEIASFSNAVDTQVKTEQRLKDKFENAVVQAYKKKTLSFNDAHELMINMGYSEDTITMQLHYADLEHVQMLKNTVISSIKEAYTDRTLTKTDVINILNQYDFNASEVNVIMSELDILRDLRFRKPTLKQLTDFFESGLMNLAEYVEELKGLGYSDKYVKWLTSGY